MSYQPREFWDRRLSEQFDLRGTGETGLSLAYNRACYELREGVLARALRENAVELRGRDVLDVGCGTGFFTAWYLAHGAHVTGLDIAPTSIERLTARHPEAHFVLADVSESAPAGTFDVVNAFDVLYHITDDARWEQAVRHLARAVRPGGVLLLTDTFSEPRVVQSHNRMRPLTRYRAVLESEGLEPGSLHPTHVLLNRELGAFRFLNRAPGLLLLCDRVLLGFGLGHDDAVSKLLVSKRRT
jgi:SAM-dependent methyltransferase